MISTSEKLLRRAAQYRNQIKIKRQQLQANKKMARVDVPPASLALGIITAERSNPTLIATIRSIRATGFKEPLHIFTQTLQVPERLISTVDKQAIVHFDAGVLGCCPNWRRAANWLLDNTPASWIMIMQDDIEWCCGGSKMLYTQLNKIDAGKTGVPRVKTGLLSPYTSPAMVAERVLSQGWTEARFYGKTKGLWGALALCFPREALANMLENKRFAEHKSNRALDYIIGDTLRNHSVPPLSVQVHLPSLVEHTGDCSTIFSSAQTQQTHLVKLRHGYHYSKNTGCGS